MCWFVADVKMEKTQILVAGIEGFDSTKLKHTETHEKNPLPDKDGKKEFFINFVACRFTLVLASFSFLKLLPLKKRILI